MNVAVHLQWNIRNAPFREDPFHPDPVNGWRMDCANYAGDGFSLVMARDSAWIPACLYTGLCLFVWYLYHRWSSKKITANYKKDVASRILFSGIKIYSVLVLLFISAIIVNALGYYFKGDMLYEPRLLSYSYYSIIKPLLIPFEIFKY